MKLHTKNGKLTAYAFHCGYVQEKEANGIRLQLWHEGGPLYHVKAFDHGKHLRLFWESFERLTDARVFYQQKARSIF